MARASGVIHVACRTPRRSQIVASALPLHDRRVQTGGWASDSTCHRRVRFARDVRYRPRADIGEVTIPRLYAQARALCLQTQPDTWLGHDPLGIRRVIAQLLPQLGREDAEIVSVLLVGRAPDLAQHLRLRHHAAGMGH